MERSGTPRSCDVEECTSLATKISGMGRVADVEIPKAEFRSPSNARADVPELGYRNYWYPAVPSRALGKKPLGIRLLGEDIVLFRSSGKVFALENRCAHRGTPLSCGKIRFPGTITCSYHGWTYNGDGVCVAVLTEGTESKVPGKARVRTYPVEERFGTFWVFVGEMEAPPIETEIPEELSMGNQLVFHLVLLWQANWRLAMENVTDPSHAPLLHRTSLRFLFMKYRAYTRLQTMDNDTGDGFFIDHGCHELERAGTTYPGVGVFPKRTWWRRFHSPLRTTLKSRFMSQIKLPGYLRANNKAWFLMQWSVPVDATSSRQYCWVLRRRTGLKAAWSRVYWHLYYKFLMRQFLGQDAWIAEAQEKAAALSQPEKLSVNDVGVIRWRRLAGNARRPESALMREDERKSHPDSLPQADRAADVRIQKLD